MVLLHATRSSSTGRLLLKFFYRISVPALVSCHDIPSVDLVYLVYLLNGIRRRRNGMQSETGVMICHDGS